jgi:hypothetical protein
MSSILYDEPRAGGTSPGGVKAGSLVLGVAIGALVAAGLFLAVGRRGRTRAAPSG